MLFVALALTLRSRDQRILTIDDGVYAHAAIMNAITAVDEISGRTLHDAKRHKQMSLAFLEREDGTTLLRLSFMAQEGLTYTHLLMERLVKERTLRIGRSQCDITDISLDDRTWSGVSTWADITIPSTGRRLRLRFATPTAIAKGGKGNRFFSLFPDPIDIFSGLARRWKALEGPPLPDDFINFLSTGGCVTANHEVQTVEFHMQDRTQIGFTGLTVYECRKPRGPHADTLRALTRLAFFTGVGYHTARGMGLVQTSITE